MKFQEDVILVVRPTCLHLCETKMDRVFPKIFSCNQVLQYYLICSVSKVVIRYRYVYSIAVRTFNIRAHELVIIFMISNSSTFQFLYLILGFKDREMKFVVSQFKLFVLKTVVQNLLLHLALDSLKQRNIRYLKLILIISRSNSVKLKLINT